MVQANVDRIIEFLKTKKSASIPDISRFLGIPKDDVQKSVEYLEEDGVLKMSYKFTTPYATFLKEPFSQANVPTLKLEEPRQNIKPEIAQNVMQKKPEQAFSLKEPPKDQKTNFLTEPSNDQKTNPLMPPPEKTLSASTAFMQFPTEEIKKKEEKTAIPDTNPLETKPSFDLETPVTTPSTAVQVTTPDLAPEPAPELASEQPKQFFKPTLEYNDEYSEIKEENYPEYASSEIDKLDFMIDETIKKITHYEFKDLNVDYRKIYNLYMDADLTPNERSLIGNKVNDLFMRIKRIYLIEKTV